MGESLLPANETFFATDLAPLLHYQVFQKNFPSTQKFWIADSGRICQTVNARGIVSPPVTCLEKLPVLCSQSAGFQAPARPETSLTVKSRDLMITGYAHVSFPTYHGHNHSFLRFRDQTSFKFFGIRYADPPVRWGYPTAYTGNKTLDARSFGPACFGSGLTPSSEDCLYLNIWTPFLPNDTPQSSLKPVVFWIHGGAFATGTGSDNTFDGGSLVSRGDVVVVIG